MPVTSLVPVGTETGLALCKPTLLAILYLEEHFEQGVRRPDRDEELRSSKSVGLTPIHELDCLHSLSTWRSNLDLLVSSDSSLLKIPETWPIVQRVEVLTNGTCMFSTFRMHVKDGGHTSIEIDRSKSIVDSSLGERTRSWPTEPSKK